MRITFVLPNSGKKPIGGFKVVYEYANHFSRMGHLVTVIHPAFFSPVKVFPIFKTVRVALRKYIKRSVTREWLPSSWFDVDSKVKMLFVPTLSSVFTPHADVVIATAWSTAEFVERLPSTKGKKYYLIQHQELWDGPEKRVMDTWKARLHKVVIARWLESIATELGEVSTYIPNGLDFSRFGCDNAIEGRARFSVAMLYHELPWKGSQEGIDALQRLKSRFPELTVELFGVYPRPDTLPSWFIYHQSPQQSELRNIYNRCSVFLAPSWAEGWPLPPAEAMMCGAALVATDIGGHREYAVDNETALLVASKSPESLFDGLVALFDDEALRIRIAKSGYDYIQQFTWDRASSAFINLLQKNDVKL